MSGTSALHATLQCQVDAGRLGHIELQPHAGARSTDPIVLSFLRRARLDQPSRVDLERFFNGRVLRMPLSSCIVDIERLERDGRFISFLTVTNLGSTDVNELRVSRGFHQRGPVGASTAYLVIQKQAVVS